MEKLYDFDEVIERRGTGCVKYDALRELYGRSDLLPMWVADMDFRSPDFVMEALRRRCDHEVLGYATVTDNYYATMQGWLRRHYAIEATRKELHFIPGIVAGISFVLQCFTVPGDKVLVTTPVYPPFLHLPSDNDRHLVCSPLKIEGGRFAIDFDDLEYRAEGCKVMILSNPHNPGGTVWSADDLARVADICRRHGLIVIADEIHADLTLPGHHHTSFSTVSEAAREVGITFLAPSKTFNIAGLSSSICYVADEGLRKHFYHWLDANGVAGGNVFALVGAEAAFRMGDDWLRQLLDYLQANTETLRSFLTKRMPEVRAILPEASFLPWFDFSAYRLSHKELADLLVNRARVALNDGTTFGGENYEGLFRMNIGCPRSVMLEGLNRIAEALGGANR